MRTFQVFDTEGKVVGSVTAESIADASKKAREGYCDFPTLVEMPKEVAMSIQKVVEEKTNLEIWLAGILEEKCLEFESKMKVPIRDIYVKIDSLFFGAPSSIQVELSLDINNIR